MVRSHDTERMRNAELAERSSSNHRHSVNCVPLKYIFLCPMERKTRKRNWCWPITRFFPIYFFVVSIGTAYIIGSRKLRFRIFRCMRHRKYKFMRIGFTHICTGQKIHEFYICITFETDNNLILNMDSEKLFIIICGLLNKLKQSWCIFKKNELRRKIVKLYSLYIIAKRNENIKKRRKYWVRPIFSLERRFQQGASENLVKEMLTEDTEKYMDYFRMAPQLFDALLALVGPFLVKEYVVREPISPDTRLQITLRYLASGDSMKSLSYAFRVAHNTISKIISETCEIIWNCLKDSVFLTDNEENWKSVADEFERLWNFPNCIGAIDGKHVQIQAPPNSGSTYYNYKGHHSINLLGISDANYCFTIVDIGAEGRQSDGGVFRNSEIGKRFETNSFKLPNPRQIEIDGPELPYVLVAG